MLILKPIDSRTLLLLCVDNILEVPVVNSIPWWHIIWLWMVNLWISHPSRTLFMNIKSRVTPLPQRIWLPLFYLGLVDAFRGLSYIWKFIHQVHFWLRSLGLDVRSITLVCCIVLVRLVLREFELLLRLVLSYYLSVFTKLFVVVPLETLEIVSWFNIQ